MTFGGQSEGQQMTLVGIYQKRYCPWLDVSCQDTELTPEPEAEDRSN